MEIAVDPKYALLARNASKPELPSQNHLRNNFFNFAEVVPLDVCGSIKRNQKEAQSSLSHVLTNSKDGRHCFQLSSKNVFHYSYEFLTCARRQTGKILKKLQSDGGRDYISHELGTYLRSIEIRHRLSCSYKPQQNSLAEHMSQMLHEMTTAMIKQRNTQKNFRTNAVVTEACARNIVTCTGTTRSKTQFKFGLGKSQMWPICLCLDIVAGITFANEFLKRYGTGVKKGPLSDMPQTKKYKSYEMKRNKKLRYQ